MPYKVGYSSEIYNIEVQDVLKLPDAENSNKYKIKSPITILISDQGDCLVSGRQIAEQALKNNISHVNVKFIFNMKYPAWKFYITFIKKFRDTYRIKGTEFYHIIPQELRKLNIERAYRNSENAFQSAQSWRATGETDNLYEKLTKNIVQNGYDDNHPMDVQICRSLGVQDTLNQGHHRMGVLIENNIKRASIRISAVGYIPSPFKQVLKLFARNGLNYKRKITQVKNNEDN